MTAALRAHTAPPSRTPRGCQASAPLQGSTLTLDMRLDTCPAEPGPPSGTTLKDHPLRPSLYRQGDPVPQEKWPLAASGLQARPPASQCACPLLWLRSSPTVQDPGDRARPSRGLSHRAGRDRLRVTWSLAPGTGEGQTYVPVLWAGDKGDRGNPSRPIGVVIPLPGPQQSLHSLGQSPGWAGALWHPGTLRGEGWPATAGSQAA